MVEIVPCTVTAAKAFVKQHHRHLPNIQGGLFACGLEIDGSLVAVAIAANPPPEWNGKRKISIARVAVAPGIDVSANACSRLYGALTRAARELGWKEAWTYTLEHEPGTSLRAAGFVEAGLTKGLPWSSPSKPGRVCEAPGPKTRWVKYL